MSGSLRVPPKLPVIDFTMENFKPGTHDWFLACNDVRHALEEYGCFIAVYEKVSQELNRAIFHVLETLFDLPTDTKVKNTSNKPYHGYVGQFPAVPIYESMGIEDATTADGVQSFSNLMRPSGNDHFCEIMHSYAKLVSELEQTVSKMVFDGYGLENYYDSQNESMTYLLRVMKYRPPKMNESNAGVLPHTDKCFMAILSQNQVNGLEVKTKDGEWFAVEYPPSSFVVMAGDAFTAWSNDRVQSPYHRVIISGYEDRYSLGLFSFSKGIIQVPEELVDENHPRKYKAFDHFGLLDFHAKEMVKERAVKFYCGV